MAQLTIVRHAQASFGSDNYDQLSDLGFQQSTWLGEYFREREIEFSVLVTGTQKQKFIRFPHKMEPHQCRYRYQKTGHEVRF